MDTSSERSFTAPLGNPDTSDGQHHPALLLARAGGDFSAVAGVRVQRRIISFDRALSIGRRPPERETQGDRAWVVPDALVSSRHARIDETGAGYELCDLGSTNGTALDGMPVTRRTKIRPGSVLFVGQEVAVFRILSGDHLTAVRRELTDPFGPVPTISPAFIAMCERLRRMAPGRDELLITGETGVGKEVYARAMHQRSGRRGAFVAVNCAAIPRELVETELFGYARGAHSEARDAKPGLIEEAEDGTLFLDEIGDMPFDLQGKLLRFAQERLLLPVGSVRPRRVDTRIIAATSRIERAESSDGRGVRSDLAARLGAEPLHLPPLRERIEDLGALTAHFLRGCDRAVQLTAFQAMALHDWPGNVRELEKALAAAVLLSEGADSIGLEHLPAAIATQRPKALAGSTHLDPTTETRAGYRAAPTETELEYLLGRHKGNVMRVAREMDRRPALIYRWVERFGLNPDNYRD